MGNEIKLTVVILSGNNEERLFMLALVVDVYTVIKAAIFT